ncbi:alpha/beta fold hydrolase [Aureisphaera galaxeae]|uniref:alpha/beta fold hydrolase n=1 Tax=Aureisphaera galaxeae TaxID=1538023 RepID=UPI00234FCCAD|nr:alpha/beta fold hydrolase [Aureisphaera galaxeae]MDC8005461.1 alpha/beta fold hydrolase [Aureisphaera galaxeae]
MKPKLLLLHGALGTRNQFNYLRSHLEDHFELFDFNFDGHGGVPATTYSIAQFAENTANYLKEQNIEDCFVFGYSMGGYVALQLERQRPGTFQKIVTLGTKFGWTPESAAKEVKMLNPDVIEEKVPRFGQKLKEDHEPLDWKEVIRNTARMMLDLGNGAALSETDFGSITTEVHLGLGSEDTMVGVEETEQIMKWLPNAGMKILEGVPHPIEKANPESVSRHIISSLS